MKIRGHIRIILRFTAVLLISLFPAFIDADLPSCYRARCSHCTVEFIAKMCPSTCGACGVSDVSNGPKLRSGRPMHNGGVSGNIRVYGTSVSSNVPVVSSQREIRPSAETSVPNTVANAAPVAHQLPEIPASNAASVATGPLAYNAAYVSQSQQSAAAQQQFQQQPNYYSIPNGVPQQYLLGQQQQTPQTTSYGSSYSSGFPSSGEAQRLTAAYGGQQQQPQQLYYAQQQLFGGAQPQQAASSYYSQAQSPLQSMQAFNFFQPQQQTPGGSPFINPFQPFLQQSLQAQQQTPFFQPFTPAPVVTPSPILVTPAPIPAQPGTGPIGSLPPPAPILPSYSTLMQPQVQSPYITQGQAPSQYSYVPQSVGQDIVRPKQIYVPQPQPQGPLQTYSVSQQQIQPQTQQQVVPAVSNNIDAVPDYVNKNSYGDKSGGQFQTCPKQPNWEPCISKEVANERFRNCCQRLGDGCSQLCSYDQTLATIQIAVLTGRCPLGKVADMMICASGYEDATACCQAYNVFEPGFEHCRPYCNPAGGLPNDGMLAEKYRCLGKLSQIQRCFYVSQKP